MDTWALPGVTLVCTHSSTRHLVHHAPSTQPHQRFRQARHHVTLPSFLGKPLPPALLLKIYTLHCYWHATSWHFSKVCSATNDADGNGPKLRNEPGAIALKWVLTNQVLWILVAGQCDARVTRFLRQLTRPTLGTPATVHESCLPVAFYGTKCAFQLQCSKIKYEMIVQNVK